MGMFNKKTKNEVFYQIEVMNDFGDFYRPNVLFETREEVYELLEYHGFEQETKPVFGTRAWRRESSDHPGDAVLASIVVLLLNDEYEEEKIDKCLRTTPLYTDE